MRLVTYAAVGLVLAAAGCGSSRHAKPAVPLFALADAKQSAKSEIFRRLALKGVIFHSEMLDNNRATADATGVTTGDPLRLTRSTRTPANGNPGWSLTYQVGTVTVCVRVWRSAGAGHVGDC